MEGLKEALEYAVSISEPHLPAINGEIYTDKNLERIDHELRADPIRMSTLTGLVDYIKSGTDDLKGKMLLHVESPTTVFLESALNSDRERECFISATAELPRIEFDSYVNNESFLIGIRAKFIQNSDRDLLMKFAGTVENGTVSQYGDDGVTQKATVKTGVASKTDAIVPNPVKLRPYRTFMEVEQPESEFVFRMRQNDRTGGVDCAIFEADGGAWKRTAMDSIKKYLEFELAEYGNITVIS